MWYNPQRKVLDQVISSPDHSMLIMAAALDQIIEQLNGPSFIGKQVHPLLERLNNMKPIKLEGNPQKHA
jgi:hypothetical protein